MTLFLIEYRGDDAGIKQIFHFLKIRSEPADRVSTVRAFAFLQDAQDLAPVRGRFPGVRRVVSTAAPGALGGGGSHGNGPDKSLVELYPSLRAEEPPHALPRRVYSLKVMS